MGVVAVIQARMGSQRLRGKSLMPLSKFSLLETVVRSAQRNQFIDKVVVATSTMEEDRVIEELCNTKGIDVFRGDQLDVLSRFIQIAGDLPKQDTIVRITADNPINNHEASLRLFEHHVNNKNDYTCVKGLSHTIYEFIKVEALISLIDRTDLTEDDREHVTMYIRNHPELFKVSEMEPAELGVRPEMDKLLTVDSKDDYDRIVKLANKVDIDEEVDIADVYQALT